MTDRSMVPTDAALERRLRDLGSHLAYPPAPDLTRMVTQRLTLQPAPRLRVWWRWPVPARALVAAVLTLVVVASAALAAFPAARTAVANWLGLSGVSIVRVDVLPSPPAAPGQPLYLGERVSLAEAQERVTYRIQLPTPADRWTPDEVYLGEPPPGGQVSFVYYPRPDLPPTSTTGVGLLLTQFQGSVEGLAGIVIGKFVEPGTRVEEVAVNGEPGFWIEGKHHLFMYYDAAGSVREESIRLAGNTLLWQHGELTLRLESALSKQEALRIAASVQ